MRKLIGMLLVLVMASSAFAVEGSEVMYKGGTIPALKEGATGRFDTSSQTSITFDSSGSKLVIPYNRIQSFQYSKQVARHYGVLLTIAVVMFKFRQRRHFLKVIYLDEADNSQVAVFEISKEMPRTLMAVLQTRAPQGCKSDSFGWDSGFGNCDIHAR